MNQSSMIEKIRALLAKTVDAGCTEAEAMFAARKAAELMDQYNLSPDAIEAGQTKATDAHYKRETTQHPIRFCGRAVGAFTNTKIYMDNATTSETVSNLFGETTTIFTKGQYLRIVGLAHEVEIAGYILDICMNAMSAAAAKALVAENDERKSAGEPLLLGGERKAWVESFQIGMATTMSATLHEMARERAVGTDRQLGQGTGNSLAVVRQDLIADWFRDQGIVLHRASKSDVRNKSGFNAGSAAGSNVRFHAGMANGARTQFAIR